MAQTVLHPLSEVTVTCHSPSIGASPIVGYARVPFRGKVLKVGVIESAAVSATATVTVAINGTSITGGAITVGATGSAAGTHNSATPTGANNVVEDDVISFTSASGGGASVTGHYYAVIRRS